MLTSLQVSGPTVSWEGLVGIGVIVGSALTYGLKFIVPALRNEKARIRTDETAIRVDEVITLARIEERLTGLSVALANMYKLLEDHVVESHDEIERLKHDRNERNNK